MAKRKGNSFSKAAVWTILILLVAGLGGFGVSNFGGTIRSIGSVGKTEIPVPRYALALQGQLRALSAQTGANVTLAQLQAFGLDRAVLGQLLSDVAVENEAATLGLSVGDAEVRRELVQIRGLQGLDGKFDREAYRGWLSRQGMTEAAFEDQLRAEIARTLVQRAVVGGVDQPAAMRDIIFGYAAERRDFSYATLGVDALETPVAAPNDADLRAYFDAHGDDFMLPETRKITYAWLTPDMIVDSVEIDEDALKALYENRISEFKRPERRLVERLVLGTAEAAAAAMARLDAGEIDFDALVAERGLALSDIDLGDVTMTELGDAGAAVFALAEPGLVGPVDTDLGPALFRVNAILSAQETPYEEARAELLDEFAMDRARRIVADKIDTIDDLLAGGATLEEIDAETELVLGKIDFFESGGGDGIAGYAAFRNAALAATVGDFPEVIELDDGGIFALRVDEIVEPRLMEFADARAQAESGWRAEETAKALAAQAEALLVRLNSGETPEALGLVLDAQTGLRRDGFTADTPEGFLDQVFAMAQGDWRVVRGPTAAYLVRLDGIAPPDFADPEISQLNDLLAQNLAQGISADLMAAFAAKVEASAGISLNQAAINAIHTQFP